jgi:hypothetical protein
MQFGPGAMQQHGFARNLDWAISSTSADPQPDDQEPEVTLLLTDNEYTRKMWWVGEGRGGGGGELEVTLLRSQTISTLQDVVGGSGKRE